MDTQTAKPMLARGWAQVHEWVNPKKFFQLCVLTLAFVVLVILWGALVRATGSGAGCGEHWPLCNGQMLPSLARYQTIIEFAHRLSSGLSLLAVFTMGHFAFRLYPKGHSVRRFVLLSMVAIVFEAAVGAGLVLLRLVEHDQSVDRAVSIAIHLVNTCFLVGALTVTAWCAVPGRVGRHRFFEGGSLGRTEGFWTLLGFIALSAAGALTALGDTLFQSKSFQEGWVRDWAQDAHFLERLRAFHPAFALFWMMLAVHWLQSRSSSVWARRAMGLLVSNLVIGAANVLLAAPLALQLVHLGVANALWICLVLSAIEESR